MVDEKVQKSHLSNVLFGEASGFACFFFFIAAVAHTPILQEFNPLNI